LRRLAWLIEHPAVGVYGAPPAIAAGAYFALTGPAWWEAFFFDHALGFLVSFWIGSGFAFIWWMVRRGAAAMPGGEPVAAAVGIAGVVLVTGLSAFTDLWLFGIAIWPGLAMLLPALERRLDGAPETGEG
jgi:hypothetical protein